MEIFPNPALAAAMTIPFVVTLVFLHVILFRPLVAYLESRAQARELALEEAGALLQQVAERTNDIEQRLAAAHSEAVALRASERTKALGVEAELVSAARAQADATIESALSEIRTATASARTALGSTAATLSTEIAAQVLGRELRA